MRILDPANMELLLRSEIPGLAPSVNHYLKHWKSIVHKTKDARKWQEAAAWILHYDWGRKKLPYEGDVYVEVMVYTPRTRQMDADNRLKTAQDAVQMGGVIDDDRQVMRSAVEKIYTTGGEKTVIEVWKWPEIEE